MNLMGSSHNSISASFSASDGAGHNASGLEQQADRIVETQLPKIVINQVTFPFLFAC